MADDAALVERYAAATGALAAVLAEIGPEGLDVDPGDGWTARQVVHHLADSETRAYLRLRQLIAEDNPVVAAYDEAEYARRLHYDRPIDSSVAVVHAVRAASLELLRRLAPADFDRRGQHPEHSSYSIRTWLEIYSDHPQEHADQMRAAAGFR